MIEYKIKVLDKNSNIKIISQSKSIFYLVKTPLEKWDFTINEILFNNANMGIYLLVSNDQNKIYVGQTKNFMNRINDHVKEKDWIEEIVFISPSRANELFSGTDLDFFEKSIIDLFYLSSEIEVLNKTSGNQSEVDPVEKIKLKDHFLELKEMLNFLFDFSEEEISSPQTNVIKKSSGLIEVYINLLNKTIEGVYDKNNKKILVKSGVEFFAKDTEKRKYSSGHVLKRFLKKDILEEIGKDKYQFTNDVWSSPSAFSDLFIGYSTNGWHQWKLKNDKNQLDVMREKNILDIPQVDHNMIIVKVAQDTTEENFYGHWAFNLQRALKYGVLAITKNFNGKLKIVKVVDIVKILPSDVKESRYKFSIKENDELNKKYKNLDVSFNKGANPVFYLDKENN